MKCLRINKSHFLVVVALMTLGCSGKKDEDKTEKPGVQQDRIIKVKVMAGGDITADGQPVTLEQLGAKLTALKQASGVVWYHRENPGDEPHPNAMKVIELVAEKQLPVKLSAKPDFSDSVDDKGLSRPDRR